MGKRGNRARQEAKRQNKAEAKATHASLDEAIHEALVQDDLEEKLIKDADEWKASIMSEGDRLEAEYKLLGNPGPPTDNVVWLGKPDGYKPIAGDYSRGSDEPFVDLLGRVHKGTSIRSYPADTEMAKRTSSNDQLPLIDSRRVTIMRDHGHAYPEMWWEIHVLGDWAVPNDEAMFAQMFGRARCTRAKSIERADLVVFGGGSDVDPQLYGETAHPKTHFSTKRDQADMEAYAYCLKEGIPMFGVCRGAQFLHVMNGGKLFQDVDGHYGDHKIWDLNQREWIQKVSSVHHQMCRTNIDGGMQILATNSDACRKRMRDDKIRDDGPKADIEAFFYRETHCLGVQGHPEYNGYGFYTKWVLDQINNYIVFSPDIETRDGLKRIKKDLLIERGLVSGPKQELN